jgi:hypothetical protein
MQTFTASICTLSWIDKRTGLPENDGNGPSRTILGSQLAREDDALPFRFLNLLEASVSIVGNRISASHFTPASKIYQNPSFAKIKSEAFHPQQRTMNYSDRVTFEQTVGARTVSPEVIAETVGSIAGGLAGGPLGGYIGDKIGRKVGHEFVGFPPIWTTLRLSIFTDGRCAGSVLCHSLFPSMNCYAIRTGSKNIREISNYDIVGVPYDACPNLDKWKDQGWGEMPETPSGPSKGNPWSLKKTDLTIRPTTSDTRKV